MGSVTNAKYFQVFKNTMFIAIQGMLIPNEFRLEHMAIISFIYDIISDGPRFCSNLYHRLNFKLCVHDLI